MADENATHTSTLSDVRRADAGAPNRWWHRAGVGLLVVLVVLGALGVFGVHSHTVRTRSGAWTLTVTYPEIARAGLDVPWRARVEHSGGLPAKITLAVSTDYFRMFETQGFFPDADTVTNDGTFVYFTFDTPRSGEVFLVDYDAYIQPGAQLGKHATVELIVAGRERAHVSLRTWLVP